MYCGAVTQKHIYELLDHNICKKKWLDGYSVLQAQLLFNNNNNLKKTVFVKSKPENLRKVFFPPQFIMKPFRSLTLS